MQTEDDTFNALIKPPIEQMYRLYADWLNTRRIITDDWCDVRERFLASYNWTVNDYIIARNTHEEERKL